MVSQASATALTPTASHGRRPRGSTSKVGGGGGRLWGTRQTGPLLRAGRVSRMAVRGAGGHLPRCRVTARRASRLPGGAASFLAACCSELIGWALQATTTRNPTANADLGHGHPCRKAGRACVLFLVDPSELGPRFAEGNRCFSAS
jgi:hypothetical protein